MSSKNKKKLSPKFPCKCGHPKSLHDWAGPYIGDEWCDGFEYRTKKVNKHTLMWPCPCEKYVPDNLKYLEQCSKKEKTEGD